MSPTILHNPNCSSSRHALQLLQEAGLSPVVVEYLKAPPSAEELDAIVSKMDAEPDAILRTRSAPEEAMAVWNAANSRAEKLAALVAHPVLIERPLVVNGDKAALIRPKAEAAAILASLGL